MRTSPIVLLPMAHESFLIPAEATRVAIWETQSVGDGASVPGRQLSARGKDRRKGNKRNVGFRGRLGESFLRKLRRPELSACLMVKVVGGLS